MKALLASMLVACALGWAGGASAAGSAPFVLRAPPPSGTPAASTIIAAMVAIERAQAANPAAAQQAAFSYNAAVELYHAHAYDRARASALTAIRQSAEASVPVVPPPRSFVPPPAFPGPRYYVIPDELPATAENASKYVASAHHAMAACPGAKAVTTEYRAAVDALNAKRYRVAMAASRNIVDDCAGQ